MVIVIHGGGKIREGGYWDIMYKAPPEIVNSWVEAAAHAAGRVQEIPKGSGPAEKFILIEENLRAAVKDDFVNHFDYAYNGDQTMPPNAVQNSTVAALDRFANATLDQIDGVRGCVEKCVKVMPIDNWAKEAIIVDLTNVVSSILVPGHKAFVPKRYTRTFSAPNGQKEVHFDGVMYHCDAADIPNSQGIPATHFLVYFSCVVYEPK